MTEKTWTILDLNLKPILVLIEINERTKEQQQL